MFAVFGEFTFDSEVDIVRAGEYNHNFPFHRSLIIENRKTGYCGIRYPGES